MCLENTRITHVNENAEYFVRQLYTRDKVTSSNFTTQSNVINNVWV